MKIIFYVNVEFELKCLKTDNILLREIVYKYDRYWTIFKDTY